MKQRLLLSLLMLMVSVGLVKAADVQYIIDVTFPEDATKDITVEAKDIAQNGAYYALQTGGNSTDYIMPVNGKITISAEGNSEKSFRITASGATTYTFGGVIAKLVVNHPNVQNITASGVELSELTIHAASSLTYLDVSNNQLKTIDLENATALEHFIASDNNISVISNLPTSLVEINIANNGYAGTGVSGGNPAEYWYRDLSSLKNLKSLDISGNKLKSVKLPNSLPVDNVVKGVQDFTDLTYKVEEHPFKANVNLSLNDLAKVLKLDINGVAIVGASDWKKKSKGTDNPDAYNETNEAQRIDQSKVEYRFYDSDYVYQHGDYECVLENEAGYKYRVRLIVSPATFVIERRNPLEHGAFIRVLNSNNVNVFTYISPEVKQGEQLTVGIEFDSETKNYEFDHFTNVRGLALIGTNKDKKWEQVPDNVSCVVAGKYNPKGDDETPYLDAKIKPAEYKVTYEQVEGGHISVYQQLADGSYSTTSLTSGSKVPYGSYLKIVVVPDNTTVKPTLTINKEEGALSPEAGSAEWTLEYKVEDDVVITQSFGEITEVMVYAYVNNKEIGKESNVSPSSVKLYQGDDAIILGKGAASDVPWAKLPVGATYQLSFKVSGLMDVTVHVGNKELPMESKSSENDANATIYTGTYTVSATSSNIYITTTELQGIKLIPTNVGDDNKTEYVTYDGNTHEFHFTTNPTGLEDKVNVTYTPHGSLELKNGLPQVAGTYTVELSLLQNDGYSSKVEKYNLVINKAMPTFNAVPTVTYNATTNSYSWNEEHEGGTYSVDQVNGSLDKNVTQLLKVTYHPLDGNNYNEVVFIQEVTGTTGDASIKLPVEVMNNDQNPAGVSIQVLNAGAVKANLKDSYLPGTNLIVLVTYPEGVSADDVNITLRTTNVGSTPTEYTPMSNPSLNIKAFAYNVPETVNVGQAETLQVNVSGKEIGKTYNVVLDKKQVVYNAARQGYPTSAIKIMDGTNVLNPAPDCIITYVGVSGLPKDVNKYDVRVRIKAGNGYAAYDKTFEDAFEIIKATPKVNKWPTASPISIGQKLMFANLEGGEVSNVTGHFEWANKEYVPENNQEKCKVIFVPNDTNNYNTVDTGGSDDNDNDNNIPVTIVNERLVTYYSNFGESQIEIIVTDETGKTYKSGDVVEKGRVLTVTTSAKNPDLELNQILVTNGENRQGNTFTVGEKSVEIEVVYQVKVPEVPEPEDPDEIIDPNSQYVVTVEKASKNNRGFILGKEGDNGVYYEDAFEFTVYALDEDLDKLVVNGATKIGKGKYRISSVTDNMTVTVSLPNPTQLDVKVVTESKNAKGYLVGKVKAESYPADGKCYYGDELVVVAYPVDGVSFAYWRDNALNKDQMREITVTKDMTIEAVFSGVPTGIEDIESAGIYAGKGYIQVKNVANADLTVVSISGRIQAQQHLEGDVQVRVPAGVYVVVLENGQDVKRVKVIVR